MNRIPKTKQGYGYKYADLSQIHELLEETGFSYYQYIQRIDGDDYVFTIIVDADGNESQPLQGCRVVQATLSGKSNPAQEQGSALTYARRYSLLMAFGLATEDDDAEKLTRTSQKPKTSRGAKKAGAPSGVPAAETITDQQYATAMDIIDAMGKSQESVCSYFHIESISNMTGKQYDDLLTIYHKWKGKKGA